MDGRNYEWMDGKDVDALCALNFPNIMGASLMKATRWMVHSVVAVFVVCMSFKHARQYSWHTVAVCMRRQVGRLAYMGDTPAVRPGI